MTPKSKGGSKTAAMRAAREAQVEEAERKTDPEVYYAAEVRAALERTTANFIETGRLLAEAKSKIEHGRWTPWVEENLPISIRTAQTLMTIAERFGTKNEKISFLPASQMVLADLAKLDDDEFEIVSKNLAPDTTRREVAEMTSKAREKLGRTEPASKPTVPEAGAPEKRVGEVEFARFRDALARFVAVTREATPALVAEGVEEIELAETSKRTKEARDYLAKLLERLDAKEPTS